jgi:hypothetical protein
VFFVFRLFHFPLPLEKNRTPITLIVSILFRPAPFDFHIGVVDFNQIARLSGKKHPALVREFCYAALPSNLLFLAS